MKRAVVYGRVSSEEQAEEGLSVDSQIEAGRRKADALGAAVVGVYRDDGVSGRTDVRRGFESAIEHCKLVQPDYLIVWSSSRFMRNTLKASAYKDLLEGLRTRVVYASQDINIWTDEGWLTDSLQQVFDENTSRQIAKDTRRSMMSAARQGFFMGGRVPFGYQAVPAPGGKRRRLLPQADEAAIVQGMFELSARGIGAFAIAVMQNEAGLTLRGRPWNKNTVLNILKSEVYMGQVIYNRFDRKRKREKPQEDWIRVQAHEPIVTEERFAEVQAGLAERVPAENTVPANTQHTFAGLLRCGACGAGLKIASGTGRGRKAYYYYACNGAVQGRRCTFKRLPADAFDRWMLDELLDNVLTRENVQSVIDQMDESATTWVKKRAARRRAMVQELRTAEQRRGNLYAVLEEHGKGAPGIHELGPRLRELNEQIKRLELALVALEDEPEPMVGQLGTSAEHATTVLREMVKGCENPKTLRDFVASIVEKIEIGETEVRVDYHPECLIRSGGAMVHSTAKWLPDLGSNQGPTD